MPSKQRINQIRWPGRQAARQAVWYAVKRGEIPPAAALMCGCGNPASEYDHHEGYEWFNRLNVVPLCKPCHTKRPREQRSYLPWDIAPRDREQVKQRRTDLFEQLIPRILERGVQSVAKESGMTPSGLYRNITERRTPQPRRLLALCRALGVDPRGA